MATDKIKGLIYKYSKSRYIIIPIICIIVKVLWGVFGGTVSNLFYIIKYIIISYITKINLGELLASGNGDGFSLVMLEQATDILVVIGLLKIYYSAKKYPLDSFDLDGFDMMRCVVFYKGIVYSIKILSTMTSALNIVSALNNILNYTNYTAIAIILIIIITVLIEGICIYFLKKVYEIPMTMSSVDEQDCAIVKISDLVVYVCIIEGIFTGIGAIVSLEFVEIVSAIVVLIFGVGLKKFKNEVCQIA